MIGESLRVRFTRKKTRHVNAHQSVSEDDRSLVPLRFVDRVDAELEFLSYFLAPIRNEDIPNDSSHIDSDVF